MYFSFDNVGNSLLALAFTISSGIFQIKMAPKIQFAFSPNRNDVFLVRGNLNFGDSAGMAASDVVADAFVVAPQLDELVFASGDKVLSFSIHRGNFVMARELTSPSSEPSSILIAWPLKVAQ